MGHITRFLKKPILGASLTPEIFVRNSPGRANSLSQVEEQGFDKPCVIGIVEEEEHELVNF